MFSGVPVLVLLARLFSRDVVGSDVPLRPLQALSDVSVTTGVLASSSVTQFPISMAGQCLLKTR